MTYEQVLERFHARRVGAHFVALCPAHPDKNPSLSITEKDGKILLRCFAGCRNEDVLAAIGLTFADLFPNGRPTGSAGKSVREKATPVPENLTATYDYKDEDANLLFQVLRYEERGKEKNFTQRRPDGKGGWIQNIRGVRRVLYNLKAVVDADNVLVVEGEKDVHTAWELDLTASCNPMGAGKWREEYSESLRGKNVTIIPDNDEPGHKHAEQVAKSLAGKAASVAICTLPERVKDLSEWPLSRESLLELIKKAPPWQQDEKSAVEELICVPFTEIQSKPVKWFWPERLVRGYINVFSGDPDQGKSTIAIDIIARFTMAREWPDKTPNMLMAGSVLVLIAEDGAEDAYKPRLLAAGADISKVLVMRGVGCNKKVNRLFALDEDLVVLESMLKAHPEIQFVVVDPASSYFRANMDKEREARRVLGPLKEMCERLNVTVLIIGHFNKRSDVGALHRVAGAVANTGLPRSVWMFMKDPGGEPGDKLMLLGKGNYAKKRTGMRYRFQSATVACDTGEPTDVPVIEWRGEETEADADSVTETSRNPQEKATARAERFLREYLADDEQPSEDILRAAEARRISRPTLWRVKKELGITARQHGRIWWWPAVADWGAASNTGQEPPSESQTE